MPKKTQDMDTDTATNVDEDVFEWLLDGMSRKESELLQHVDLEESKDEDPFFGDDADFEFLTATDVFDTPETNGVLSHEESKLATPTSPQKTVVEKLDKMVMNDSDSGPRSPLQGEPARKLLEAKDEEDMAKVLAARTKSKTGGAGGGVSKSLAEQNAKKLVGMPPEERKQFLERLEKNREAARKSRKRRRQKEGDLKAKVLRLEEENAKLRVIHVENERLKCDLNRLTAENSLLKGQKDAEVSEEIRLMREKCQNLWKGNTIKLARLVELDSDEELEGFARTVYADNCVVYDSNNGGAIVGIEDIVRYHCRMRKTVLDASVAINEIESEGCSKMRCSWTLCGKYNGRLPVVNSNHICYEGVTLLLFKHRKIVEQYVTWDAMGLMSKLGVLLEPGVVE